MRTGGDGFSNNEHAVLQFLKKEYLRNTSQTARECPESKSIIERFGLGQDEYYTMMARFEVSGWAKVAAKGCVNEFVKIDSSIVEIIRQLENPPLPDYRDKLTKWFWSKRWSLVIYVLVVGVPALVAWVVMLMTILGWIRITRS